jgi:tetratricopeptide (TPR) repeat protein
MIERLLAADAALARGELDAAERLFRQVADADGRNAIAAVGLGRVAAGRDDADGARTWFVRALEIDPQEAAARRLLAALDRELALGVPVADPEAATPPRVADAPSTQATQPAARSQPGSPSDPPPTVPRKRPALLARIRTWLGRTRRD